MDPRFHYQPYQSFTKPNDAFPLPHHGSSRNAPSISPTPDHIYAAPAWPYDEKFVTYDSSPDSMISYSDENCYSPIYSSGKQAFPDLPQAYTRKSGKTCLPDEYHDNHVESLNLRHILSHYLYQYQDEIVPATSFPVALDAWEESLIVSFMTNYAEASGFSPYLRPHPTAITVATSITNPALLHCVIAIAAQYRLSNKDYHSVSEQRSLEYTAMRHRGDAIQVIRDLSNKAVTDSKHNITLITSSIALGKLDLYSADADTASIHFRAARQVLQTTGWDPYPAWLARMMIHYEFSVGTTTESYLWDFKDFPRLLIGLNQFLHEFWVFGNTIASPYKATRRAVFHHGSPLTNSYSQQQTPYLTPDSILLECLSQTPQDPSVPTTAEGQELLFQLGSLLTLSNVMMSYQSDLQGMTVYLDSISELAAVSQIQHRSSKNLMWLLQFDDRSSKRTELNTTAAGWAWVLRHVNYSVQRMVKDWLLAILTGRLVLRPLKLDAFAFSYAS